MVVGFFWAVMGASGGYFLGGAWWRWVCFGLWWVEVGLPWVVVGGGTIFFKGFFRAKQF